MGSEDKGSFWGVITAGVSGGLFVLFWLGLSIPFFWSAGASLISYGALWLILKGSLPRKDNSLGTEFVDKKLAEKVVTEGKILVSDLERIQQTFSKSSVFYENIAQLTKVLSNIVQDVVVDPRDAAPASSFLGFQGQAALRLAEMAHECDSQRMASSDTEGTKSKILENFSRLIKASENHLARLQSDNLTEMSAELDVLETSLGLDQGFDKELEQAQGFVKDKSNSEKKL